MRIQEAVKACSERDNLFGRPVSWKGAGKAIDLARRLDKTRVHKVTALQTSPNVIGEEWNVDPQDFLGRWEVITAEDLAKETQESKA